MFNAFNLIVGYFQLVVLHIVYSECDAGNDPGVLFGVGVDW